jgi:hypothetical protein
VASTSLEKRPADSGSVEPHDEPSAEWGWHGGFPWATRIAGWFTAVMMFAMLIGNHTGRVEDLWLIGTGLAIVVGLVWDMVRRRTAWRR